MNHLIKFIFGLSLALTLSGCYIGNQTVYLPTPVATGTSDTISGYYLANPSSLKFYATEVQTIEKDAPVTQIPAEITQDFTNPLIFVINDYTSGASVLAAPDATSGFPVTVNTTTLALSYSATTRSATFWQDPKCTSSVLIKESGTLTQNANVAAPAGNTYPLKGSLQLTLQVITRLQGNCTASFVAMYACYQESTQCGGTSTKTNLSLQGEVIHIFAPWINSGTIQASDIPNLTGYAYEVTYQ